MLKFQCKIFMKIYINYFSPHLYVCVCVVYACIWECKHAYRGHRTTLSGWFSLSILLDSGISVHSLSNLAFLRILSICRMWVCVYEFRYMHVHRIRRIEDNQQHSVLSLCNVFWDVNSGCHVICSGLNSWKQTGSS